MMLFTKRGCKKAARIPDGERLYVIGDVHGEAELLADLLREIAKDAASRPPASTTLVFLGDIVDRGLHGMALLQTLRIAADGPVVILKGNREDLLVSAYSGDMAALRLWLEIGGRETLEGAGVHLEALGPKPNQRVETERPS